MRRLLIAVVATVLAAPLVMDSGPAAQGRGGDVTIAVGGGGAAPAGPAAPLGPMSFEVASVKPNNSGDGNIRFGIQPGGRFTAVNVPVRQLIIFAYQLQNFQLIDAPAWTQNERYDILASAGREIPNTPLGQAGPIQMMVRSLLADRFKLVVRNERRELPTYALMLNRPDGRLGAALKPAATDCAALFAAARGRGGAPAPPDPNAPIQCGQQQGPGRIRAGSVSMRQFAQSLSGTVQRVVVDKTGLMGNFDFELTFTPDQLPQGPAPPGAPPLPASDGPSIFTALQEQLGLKLEAERGQVDVVVVQSVDRATPD
jgi:uncharacterized protein (TIGR03435 family)